jgi:hypothetical protein
MRGIIILALLALPAEVHAQQVYKCPGKGGVPSYQSEPCSEGQASKTWDARPENVSPADQARIDQQLRDAEIAAQQRRVQSSTPALVTWQSGPTQSQQRRAGCEAARRERDAALERLGLKRTFEDLRRWGDYVTRACRGV